MASKHKPQIRLKALRKIIGGITQERFARLIGVSYPYFLAIETGQRGMTEALLKRVVVETGIAGEWLDGVGSQTEPVDVDGRPYTQTVYLEWKESAKAPFDSVAPHYDAKLQRGLWLVAQFLRAAARSGRFGPAMHLLQWAIDDSATSLGIADRLNDEQWTQPDPLITRAGLGVVGRQTTRRNLGRIVESIAEASNKGGLAGVIDEMRAYGADDAAVHASASVLSPTFVCRIREAAASGDRVGATKALEFARSTFSAVERALIGSKKPNFPPAPEKALVRWTAAAARNQASSKATATPAKPLRAAPSKKRKARKAKRS